MSPRRTKRTMKSLSLNNAELLLRRPGTKLMMMHTNDPKEPMAYYILPGGYISASIAEKLIARPDVVPNQDGLLPDTTQSWQLIYHLPTSVRE